MANIRDILIQVGTTLEARDELLAKGLKFEEQIYIAPSVTWFSGGAPLEIQVVDMGETVLDRDGSVRRSQISLIIAILMRKPIEFEGRHASVLSSLDEDLHTYTEIIRDELDGNFLVAAPIITDTAEALLERPLVHIGTTDVQERADYPDLMIKQLQFIGGINRELRIFTD